MTWRAMSARPCRRTAAVAPALVALVPATAAADIVVGASLVAVARLVVAPVAVSHVLGTQSRWTLGGLSNNTW